MNYPEGSCWRKWDLHVHTPESMGHQYGVGGKDPWEAFLDDLEALPKEIKVIGVNDYIFIDGYKRLRKEKENGRLENIDLFLPVIELRLDKFGGSEGQLSRINYHIIFSDEVAPEVIEQQFLNALSSKYVISPQYAEVAKQWVAVPTRKSLEDLGNLIIQSVPEDKRHQFKGPLEEGFNNLNFTLEGVELALRNYYFPGKYLTAIGKTEWADIKWNNQTIAEKKNLINSVNIVFTSSSDPLKLSKARASLVAAKVNDRLFDCSDAHNLLSSANKDRLGKCFTWLKADTTFWGLQRAVHEYPGRVFLGDEPPKLEKVRSNTTKYIRSLGFSKKPQPTLDEAWFEDVSLTFSKDLIAIIGNKGSGKSALADTIGLLGNSKQEDSFSFLNDRRFRDPQDNKAVSFSALLEWESRATESKCLNDSVEPESVEGVKYIPQHFLEALCNDTPGGIETSFDKEVKKVIFSHVPKADRLGHDSIDTIISDKASAADSAISYLKTKLEGINDLIADLEHKNTREYKETVQNQLNAKKDELTAHEKHHPIEVKKPENDPTQKERLEGITREIAASESQIQLLNQEIARHSDEHDKCVRQIVNIDKVSGFINVFRRQYNSLREECEPLLEGVDIAIDSLVKLKINTAQLDQKKTELEESLAQVARLLDPENENSPAHKSNKLTEKIQSLEQQLDQPNKDYQLYVESLRKWAERKTEIEGDESSIGTIKYLEKQLQNLDGLTVQLSGIRNTRMEIVREIYGEINSLSSCYRGLYAPIQKFIAEHPLAKETVPLLFEVSVVNTKFQSGFLEKINQRAAGSFAGIEDGERLINEIVARHDFNTIEGVTKFLTDVMDRLSHDKRPIKNNDERRVADQLKMGFQVSDLYNFIFSLDYLEPRYILKLGEKELHQLSPGEKGTLLLIFYLLVDRNEIPLVLDQPDENIDQQTVFTLLVPCIKEAKKTRQIFIVTHNPNLAVVCDAEQFIYCSIDKADKNRIFYKSGALENPGCNIKASTILEGTLPAFDNRNAKYIRPI